MTALPTRAATPAPAPLRCTLTAPRNVPVGQPVMLTFTLRNAGTQALRVLSWNTPFEGEWFAPFVEVTRAGQSLAYAGAMMKRGAPAADEYFTQRPRAARTARIDLARAFDLRTPGRYTVQPRLVLFDVGSAASRSNAAPQSQPLECNPVEIDLQ